MASLSVTYDGPPGALPIGLPLRAVLGEDAARVGRRGHVAGAKWCSSLVHGGAPRPTLPPPAPPAPCPLQTPAAQRHVAKPSAMTPLSAVLAEVCAKMKPPLDPGRCTLLLNKKPLDLSLPFRLANIPNGSALVLQCSGGRAGERETGTTHVAGEGGVGEDAGRGVGEGGRGCVCASLLVLWRPIACTSERAAGARTAGEQHAPSKKIARLACWCRQWRRPRKEQVCVHTCACSHGARAHAHTCTHALTHMHGKAWRTSTHAARSTVLRIAS